MHRERARHTYGRLRAGASDPTTRHFVQAIINGDAFEQKDVVHTQMNQGEREAYVKAELRLLGAQETQWF